MDYETFERQLQAAMRKSERICRPPREVMEACTAGLDLLKQHERPRLEFHRFLGTYLSKGAALNLTSVQTLFDELYPLTVGESIAKVLDDGGPCREMLAFRLLGGNQALNWAYQILSKSTGEDDVKKLFGLGNPHHDAQGHFAATDGAGAGQLSDKEKLKRLLQNSPRARQKMYRLVMAMTKGDKSDTPLMSYAREFMKYRPDQRRDERGRFSSGGSSGTSEPKQPKVSSRKMPEIKGLSPQAVKAIEYIRRSGGAVDHALHLADAFNVQTAGRGGKIRQAWTQLEQSAADRKANRRPIGYNSGPLPSILSDSKY